MGESDQVREDQAKVRQDFYSSSLTTTNEKGSPDDRQPRASHNGHQLTRLAARLQLHGLEFGSPITPTRATLERACEGPQLHPAGYPPDVNCNAHHHRS